ncbi:hypothetical protein [Gluconobacter albidus]|nr:hypothetical protein [Gluconobacter albidus]
MNKVRLQFIFTFAFMVLGLYAARSIPAAAQDAVFPVGPSEDAPAAKPPNPPSLAPKISRDPVKGEITSYPNLTPEGIDIVRQINPKRDCSVQVIIHRDRFLDNLSGFSPMNYLPDFSNKQEAYNHRYSMYLDISEAISPDITKLIMGDPHTPNQCYFSFGFSGEKFTKGNRYWIIIGYAFTKSLFDKMDWNRVNSGSFPSVAYVYYISPGLENLIERQEAGFKDAE